MKPREMYDSVPVSIHNSGSDMRAIAESSNVDCIICARAVGNLVMLNIVRRDHAYRKPKKTIYTISNGIVRFYYDVMARGEAVLQSPDSCGLYRALAGYIGMFYEGRFEDLCKEYVAPNYPRRWIGRWWGAVPVTSGGTVVMDEDSRVQTEDADVNVVAKVINGDDVDLLLCEYKFTARRPL